MLRPALVGKLQQLRQRLDLHIGVAEPVYKLRIARLPAGVGLKKLGKRWLAAHFSPFHFSVPFMEVWKPAQHYAARKSAVWHAFESRGESQKSRVKGAGAAPFLA
jgi:hypothetical protein